MPDLDSELPVSISSKLVTIGHQLAFHIQLTWFIPLLTKNFKVTYTLHMKGVQYKNESDDHHPPSLLQGLSPSRVSTSVADSLV